MKSNNIVNITARYKAKLLNR